MTATRVLPTMSDTDGWTADLVFELAGLPVDTAPATEGDLLATYGTADPTVLRAGFALAEDVALAERLAAGSEVTR
jgi:hypothetical protein